MLHVDIGLPARMLTDLPEGIERNFLWNCECDLEEF